MLNFTEHMKRIVYLAEQTLIQMRERIIPALGLLLTAICIYLFVAGLSGMFSVPWLP